MRMILVVMVCALALPAAAVSMVEPTVDGNGVPLGTKTAAGDNSLLACMVWINGSQSGQWLKPTSPKGGGTIVLPNPTSYSQYPAHYRVACCNGRCGPENWGPSVTGTVSLWWINKMLWPVLTVP